MLVIRDIKSNLIVFWEMICVRYLKALHIKLSHFWFEQNKPISYFLFNNCCWNHISRVFYFLPELSISSKNGKLFERDTYHVRCKGTFSLEETKAVWSPSHRLCPWWTRASSWSKRYVWLKTETFFQYQFFMNVSRSPFFLPQDFVMKTSKCFIYFWKASEEN